MKKFKRVGFKKFNVILILILLVGLALRLTGILHGFPFIFHPDEPTIVRSALGVRFDPNPKHFDWPHFYIYLNYFLYMIFARFRSFIVAVGLRDKIGVIFPLIWDEKFVFYYLTRCFSAILGGLTAIPVYLTGKNLFGKRAGLLGALAIALMPYHVWHSHYSLGDIPMVFLLSWGLYFSSLILKENKVRNYLFSGLFIGLSASTKYNGGLSALMVPVAHFLRVFGERSLESQDAKKDPKKVKIIDFKGVLYMFLSGLAAFIGFLIGTPYALLDFKTFSRTDGPQGAFWQFKNVGSVTFSEHIGGFFTDVSGKLASDTGYIAMAVYILGFFYLVFRVVKKRMEQKDTFLLFLYIISLFLVWYISGFERSRSHYYFIFYPFVAVIFGFFADFLQKVFRKDVVNLKEGFENENLIKISSWIIFSILYAPLFVFSTLNAYRYYRDDTRVDFYKWMISNYHLTETVVYNDNKIEDVFGAIGVSAIKDLEDFDKYDKSMLVVLDPEAEEKFLGKYSGDINMVASFYNKLRLGPNIEVYRYNKLENDLESIN